MARFKGPVVDQDEARFVRRQTLSLSIAALTAMVVFTNTVGAQIQPQPKMGEPLLGLSAEELDRFMIGQNRYASAVDEEDGRGPIYNHFGCGFCHTDPLGGTGSVEVVRFAHVSGDTFDPLIQFGGPVRQELSNEPECLESISLQANFVRLRITNGALGYGLIEAIPDADLLALESTGPRISGRAHIVEALEDPGVPRVGRFGWKAILPTILSFSADAARNEIGLTNRLLPVELDPNGDDPPNLDDPDFCDLVADPEDGPEGDIEGAPHFIDRVTDFQRFIAPPPQTPRSGMGGEALFDSIGCTSCHHASFVTSDDPDLEPFLRSQTIRPYSDFLLHDMGDAGDGYPELDAGPTELRTTPLWGLRARELLWHDGRFEGTFEEKVADAILEHGAAGSEAVDVIANWNALDPDEQARVITFLDSLGHIEFDFDHNNRIEFTDFIAFEGCFFDEGTVFVADHPCAVADIDQDGDVDENDYDSFLIAYLKEGLGPQDDCNENTVLDLTDIILGSSTDKDLNGIPDDCQTTPVLELVLSGDSAPFGAGDTVEVTLVMRDLGVLESVGFQAFLEFDVKQMTFVSGEYTEVPFGQAIISPIATSGAHIDLSAGIDALGGQTAVDDDAPLATLTFQANVPICTPTMSFRDNTPPTQIALDDGNAADPIETIDLASSSCIGDVDGDTDVGFTDLLSVLSAWGPCPGCDADVVCDGEVDFTDLLTILAAWGPCAP